MGILNLKQVLSKIFNKVSRVCYLFLVCSVPLVNINLTHDLLLLVVLVSLKGKNWEIIYWHLEDSLKFCTSFINESGGGERGLSPQIAKNVFLYLTSFKEHLTLNSHQVYFHMNTRTKCYLWHVARSQLNENWSVV